jgi:hypothetical protein
VSAAPLARALLDKAARLWRTVGADEPALAAIDDFVATPSPSRYLRAARLLTAAARAARAARLDATFAGRAFDHGLARLQALPYLDAARAADLAATPLDPRAGHRLTALAMLLEAHHELAARVRRVDADRRQHLIPVAVERRRVPPNRRIRRTRKTARRTSR